MSRLSLKIYLTIVASLLLVVVLAGGLWRFRSDGLPGQNGFEMAGVLLAVALPPAAASHDEQAAALSRLGRQLAIDLALLDAGKRQIASVGRPLPMPGPDREAGGWLPGRGGPAWAFVLPDGRWIIARAPSRHRHPAIGLVLFIAAIAGAVALAAYPIVRGLTGRLERLQAGVETWGGGNLAARVPVEGRDEIARLATSFNASAARIEELIAANKALLANASHELRTPLARVRMGLELAGDGVPPARRADIERDLVELDELIDEILLTSRLEATPRLDVVETVDLLALAAEEAARTGGHEVLGDVVHVDGDPRLLRRIVRNLIQNADRHGKPPVAILVARDGARAILRVADSGSGIPEAERERVFEPFYRVPGRSASTGTGLGLALVRQIARRHGGEARIAPSRAGLTVFEVTLPAREAA